MASATMPDEFHDPVAHHRPPEPLPGVRGGRPRCPAGSQSASAGSSRRPGLAPWAAASRARSTPCPWAAGRNGLPLVIRTAGANAGGHRQLSPTVMAFPEVGGRPGRPKELPDDPYADRG